MELSRGVLWGLLRGTLGVHAGYSSYRVFIVQGLRSISQGCLMVWKLALGLWAGDFGTGDLELRVKGLRYAAGRVF